MRALLFMRRFWTLAVREDPMALMDFVAKVPHSESTKTMAPFMGKTKLTQWGRFQVRRCRCGGMKRFGA